MLRTPQHSAASERRSSPVRTVPLALFAAGSVASLADQERACPERRCPLLRSKAIYRLPPDFSPRLRRQAYRARPDRSELRTCPALPPSSTISRLPPCFSEYHPRADKSAQGCTGRSRPPYPIRQTNSVALIFPIPHRPTKLLIEPAACKPL